MPVSAPTAQREPLHQRSITVQGFKRADGLYDIEATLIDTKAVDFILTSGLRRAGEPVHAMTLRITVDTALTIVDAEASTDAMPYTGECGKIAPHYRNLIGLSIRPGFTAKVRELFAGTAGCTHLTDLIGVAATTAFQTLAGQLPQDQVRKPHQLDRCHALKTDAPSVAKYYPGWYRGKPLDRGEPG
ncbi:MAG: DUF2889 domain-containing protein [Betaproteobacteria bacterium]|nr:DUF2889 domain-containing protein [Betaproteobacteria bacterium]